MFPFDDNSNIVMACHLTGIYDVNRNTTLKDNDYSLVEEWAESMAALQLNAIIFHNNFDAETCRKYQNKKLAFIQVKHSLHYNPNIYRYFIYQDFLRLHKQKVCSIFLTDITDVVVLKNPFIQLLFIDNPLSIFCGDEPEILNNKWMKAHSTHLRSRIADYENYEETYKNEMLLNCGIIGGSGKIMEQFIEEICGIHQLYNHDNVSAFTGDMGAFNYLIRTRFNGQIIHGNPLNTQFKSYQSNRIDCWFRHK